MAARVKAKTPVAPLDATRWRRFLSSSPPLDDLVEIRRLHDNKTNLRRRGAPPPTVPARAPEPRPS